jgi:AcrR family transcriptional regulator
VRKQDTKEKILLTALKLFATDGFEAVSMQDIGKAIHITKGALYRHYADKRAIFLSIVQRMAERDCERAGQFSMPQEICGENAKSYRATTLESLKNYAEAQFDYWTADKFASAFRRMLMLEQFRNPKMTQLLGQFLGVGVLAYLEDVFREMELPCEPKRAALKFWGPVYLLIGVYDGANGKEDREAIRDLAISHIRHFLGDKE